jgi:hypothetical protein
MSIADRARKFVRWSVRVSGGAVLFFLPVAYVPESSQESQVVLGVYGGGGQAATIISDCGGYRFSDASSFGDVAAQAAYVTPLAEHSHMVVGTRSGYSRVDIWSESELRDSVVAGGSLPPTRPYKYGYFNPHVSW